MGTYIPNTHKPKRCRTCAFNMGRNMCRLEDDYVNEKNCPIIEIDDQTIQTVIKIAKALKTLQEVE